MSIRVKICGIASVAEARLAIRYGASMLGMVAEHDVGTAPLDTTEIAHIAATLPPGITAVVLTHRTDAAGILDLQHHCRVSAIQLLSPTTSSVRQAILEGAPGVQLLQVVPLNTTAPDEAIQQAALHSNAVLLDAGSMGRDARGRPGQLRDWTRCRQLVRAAAVPIVLSGGLSGDTVRAAIRAVRPYGVDAGAGLRTNGQLDSAALAVFASGVSHATRSGSSCVAWPG